MTTSTTSATGSRSIKLGLGSEASTWITKTSFFPFPPKTVLLSLRCQQPRNEIFQRVRRNNLLFWRVSSTASTRQRLSVNKIVDVRQTSKLVNSSKAPHWNGTLMWVSGFTDKLCDMKSRKAQIQIKVFSKCEKACGRLPSSLRWARHGAQMRRRW